MAGNIVKWWKHKILGGYKQFSVQECTTDSEELMYHQVRASSSCSAPPDLLLVSERDNNIQLRSPVVNIITTPPGNALSSTTKQQQQQQQHHHTHHHQATGQQHVLAKHQDISGSSNSKHLRITSSSTGGKHNGKYVNVQQHPHQQQQQQNGEDVLDGSAHPHAHPQEQNQQQQEAHQQSRHLHQSHKEERIRLEEFTCDVSVEGGKSSQPLQFSFTFYDLDGHHGKITKDDIVGIVYTIYESIGKSVVVPHCGSKTINVRLTVSPEGKSKAHQATATPAATCNNNKLKKLPTGLSAAGTAGASKTVNSGALTTSVGAGARRQHRYRPRKLIKSDDEDDDSNSEKEKELRTGAAVGAELPSGSSKPSKSSHSRYQKNNAKLELGCQQPEQQQQQQQQHTTENAMANSNTYANMLNLKCCAKEEQQRPSTDIYMKQATQRVKMLRRARKQKYQDHCIETRQRSLSVGNETCWQNRHLQQQKQLQHQAVHPSSTTHKSASPPLGDVIDGVQLRQPRSGLWAQQRKSAECWKSALNRNDLIGIIRESMEKNRLCFQLNGKPQANVSPIRQAQSHHQQQQQQQQQQRLRSNTVSKIPTLIAHHSPAITQQPPNLNANPNPGSACNSNSNNNTTPTNNHNSSNSNSNNNNNHIELSSTAHDTGSSSLNHSHSHPPQPHIPIYHQQLAINPAVLAAQHSHSAHSKLNLCGYDSFLHATICGGGSSHSSPPASAPPPQPSAPTTTTTTHGHVHGSNVATVQPIVTTAIPKQQHQQQKSSHKLLRSGSCNNGSYSNNMAESQGQGYQRLSCSTSTRQNVGSLSSKEYKNYGNLIYAKLSEQLQQKGERRQRHKQQQQQQQHKQQSAGGPTQEPVQRPETSSSGGSQGSKTLHPLVFGDALECAHLLAPSNSEGEESTSGDLSSSSQPALASTPNKVVVSTDTLIDLNDDVGEAVAEAVTGKQVDTDDAVDVELDTSATSSMIHRYVHEHIHHHYHHFKEQHDV